MLKRSKMNEGAKNTMHSIEQLGRTQFLNTSISCAKLGRIAFDTYKNKRH